MMKTLLVIPLIFSVLFLSAQDYDLFNQSSKKLFADATLPGHTYSISIDTTIIQGSTTFYFNFFNVDTLFPNYISDSCSFWNGPWCKTQSDASWIGKKIEKDSVGNYSFYNRNNDDLFFEFSMPVGDSSVFFQNLSNRFYIIRIPDDTLPVFSNTDSVHIYEILHTDLSGNVINSALNGEKIKLSKNYGLIRFLRVDSFPFILQPVEMIGIANPGYGINAVTSEFIYDYQPADEIQTKEIQFCYQCPPWEIYTRWRKLEFLSRLTTSDSLIYSCKQTLFYDTSAYAVIDTITLKYYRYDTIARLPFEKFNGSFLSFQKKNFCGLDLWEYNIINPNFVTYCENENCWGQFEIFLDPYTYEENYVAGLGRFHYARNPIFLGPPQPPSYTTYNDIVYFRKNGIPCGNESFAGINENELSQPALHVLPNPASVRIKIKSSLMLKSVALFDLTGRNVFYENTASKEAIVNISDFENGIYLLQCQSVTGRIISKKVMIVH